MDIMKFFPSKYLRGVDLNGRIFNLAIDRVELHNIRNNKTNQTEKKPVLFFRGAGKGLIVSAPVARQIATLHGSETDNWPGKRVALFAEDVEAFGKTHRVVRVKPLVPPEPEKPEPAAPALTDAAEIEDHEIDAEDEIPLGLDDE